MRLHAVLWAAVVLNLAGLALAEHADDSDVAADTWDGRTGAEHCDADDLAALLSCQPLQRLVKHVLDVDSYFPSNDEAQYHSALLQQLFQAVGRELTAPGADAPASISSSVLAGLVHQQAAWNMMVQGDAACDAVAAVPSCRDAWVSASAVFAELEDRMQRVARFISKVWRFTVTPQRQRQETLPDDERVKVLVVGAGPVGLLHAIEAVRQGALVTQVEKRSTYARDLWFDLDNAPRALWLGPLGFLDLDTKVKQWDEETSSTYRAQTLERFFAKVAALSGVRQLYSWEHMVYCLPDRMTAGVRPYALLHSTMARGARGLRLPSDFRWTDMCDKKKFADLIGSSPAMLNEFRTSSFDLIVGVEGRHSRVRRQADVPYQLQRRFKLAGYKEIAPPKVYQPTLLVSYKPRFNQSSGEWQCPAVKTDEHGAMVPPWHQKQALPHVPLVFKRFYYGNCTLQMLFTRDVGDRIIKAHTDARVELRASAEGSSGRRAGKRKSTFWIDPSLRTEDDVENDGHDSDTWQLRGDAIPWDLMVQVHNQLLQEPVANAAELRRWLLRRDAERADSAFDISVFNVLIRAADRYAMITTPSMSATEEAELRARAKRNAATAGGAVELTSRSRLAMVVLAGDAFVTAHYRLGIGVNKAFDVLDDFGQLIRGLCAIGAANFVNDPVSRSRVESLLWNKNALAMRRQESVITFQLLTMYYESFCDLIVFIDPYEADLPRSIVAFDQSSTEYDVNNSLTWRQIVDLCPQ